MVDDNSLDELDRQLEEYNRKATGPKLRSADVDGGYDIGRYQFQLEAVNNSIHKLNVMAESFEKDLVSVDKRKTEDFYGLIAWIFLFVICMGGTILFGWWALTLGIGGAVSFGMLCLSLTIGACITGLKFVNGLTAYLVKTRSGPHSNIVEENNIRHYEGEKEYYLSCIGDLHSHVSELRRIAEKIEKKGHITEQDMEKVRRLGKYIAPSCIYRTEKYTIGEWVRYRLRHRL